MSNEALEQLLFRGESESLDFKRDQYVFVGATDEQKAKLLKDILAMANSWRTETAHILIGVDAPLGVVPQVTGLTQHLDDAMLQQFVNSKTQRPVLFRYSESDLRGKTVGVIEIPVQRRPLHTVSNFAGVQAKVVYTRRGSSNAEASPDEIASMGAAIPVLEGRDLQISFAAPGGRQLVGQSLAIDCLDLALNEPGGIPDYGENQGYVPVLTVNRDFWRDFAEFITVTELMRPAALTVSNRGRSAAKDVRLEFVIDDPDRDLHFIAESQVPKRPSRGFGFAIASMPQAMAAAMKQPPFEAEHVGGAWHLAFNLGTLQPARTLFPAIPFFVGSKRSKSIEMAGRVLAENLPAPVEFSLSLKITTSSRTITLDQLEVDYERALSASDSE